MCRKDLIVRSITIEQFAPLSRQGGFDLIDVRTPNEFYEVHAVGALMMPLDGLNPAAIMESREQRREEPLYIICRSGSRSAQACAVFERAGFTNVVNVEGGTLAWITAGLPVNRGIRRPISIERQIRIVSGLVSVAGTLGALITPWSLLLPGLTGAAMVWSGYTNSRAMGRLFSRLPWNRNVSSGLPSSCGTCTGGSCSGS
jgi:rhodanese-related sulfurtransferase